MKILIEPSFLLFLTIVFIILKLCGVIAWSWWMVLLPFLIWLLFFVAIIIFACFVACKRGVI